MRVAIPAEDDRGIKSNVSKHFGRSRYFVFVDIEGEDVKNVEVVEVPFEEHGPGDLPNFIKDHGAKIVLTYGIGRRAIEYFNSLGISVVTGVYGRISDVIKAFIGGKLKIDYDWKEKIEKEH